MECSLCFTKKKTGNPLQNFRCPNCVEDAWHLCEKCYQKIKQDPNLSGKCPMCRGIEIRDAEITYHRTSTDVVLNAVVSQKKNCLQKIARCLKSCIEFKDNNGETFSYCSCVLMYNLIFLIMGVFILGLILMLICTENGKMCLFCIINSYLISFILTSLLIFYIHNLDNQRSIPSGILIMLGFVLTIMFTSIIANDGECQQNWSEYVLVILILPTTLYCLFKNFSF